MPNIVVLPAVAAFAADLDRTAQMNRTFSPAVLALSKLLHEIADMPQPRGWLRGGDTMKRAAAR